MNRSTTMSARTTSFIFDNGEYFAAHLNNGGIRVGMNGVCALDVPAGHPLYAEAMAVTENTVEAFIDAQVEAGRIDIHVF